MAVQKFSNPMQPDPDAPFSAGNPYGLQGAELADYKQKMGPMGQGTFSATDKMRRMQMSYNNSGNQYATGVATDDPNYKPPPPPEKDELTKTREAMQKQADQYGANSGLLKDQMFGSFANQERGRLANQMTSINEGASRRGLLFSGMRQGAQAGARAESSQALAKTRYGINQGVDEQARKMQLNARKADLQSVDQSQNLEDSIYSNALSNMSARNRAIGDLFSGIGYVGGAYAAGQFNSPSVTPVDYSLGDSRSGYLKRPD